MKISYQYTYFKSLDLTCISAMQIAEAQPVLNIIFSVKTLGSAGSTTAQASQNSAFEIKTQL